MERVTKEMLYSRVTTLNDILKLRGIDKVFEIGYRNGYTYIDQQAKDHKRCIQGTSFAGTKKEAYTNLSSMIKTVV